MSFGASKRLVFGLIFNAKRFAVILSAVSEQGVEHFQCPGVPADARPQHERR